MRAGRLLGVLVGGAVGGALCDQIHVQAGAILYPADQARFLPDQSWWVGPQFGVAMVVVVLTALPFARRTTRRAAPELAVGAVLFVLAYLASGVFDGRPAALLSGYVVAWLVRVGLTRADERAVVVVYSIALALGGCLYEGALAGTGAFSYARPDVFHVPMWLAGIYLHGAPLALMVANALDGGMAPRLVRPGSAASATAPPTSP